MFCVYKARMNSKYVTLKTPRHADSMLRDMLLREYELSHTLAHPSIVTTLAFSDTTPLGTAIIREYVEGETLDDYLTHRPSKSALREVEHNILDAIEYLHHRGISHNDIKPENIIVTRGNMVRIIDFGLSLSDDSAYRGCVGGTPEFTAPEVLASGTVEGNASDIYSIGALLRYMYGDKRYRRTVRRAMSLDPEQRYLSIAQMRSAMRRESTLRRLLPVTIIAVIAVVATTLITMLGSGSDKGYDSSVAPSDNVHESTTAESLRTEINRLYDKMDSIARGEQYREIMTAKLVPYRYSVQQFVNNARMDDALWSCIELDYVRGIQRIDSIYLQLPSITTLSEEEYYEALSEIDSISNTYLLHYE